MICRTLCAGLLAAGALSTSSLAQTSRPAAATNGWLPRTVQFAQHLTPAQRASAIATLDRIERLFRQVPELANPDGFEILPSLGGGNRQLGPDDMVIPGSLVEYAITFVFFFPSRAIAGEGSSAISVRVNPTISPVRPLRDAQGRIIYIEAARAMRPVGTQREIDGTLWEVPSATQVYGELWDFSRDIREGRGERSGITVSFVGAGELPWAPVSREAYYAAVRLDRDGKDGGRATELRSALSKTPYQQWMEEAPERKKARDEAIEAARQFQTPEKVAELKKRLEDTDRQVTEQLQKSDAADRERNREALAANDARSDAFTRELEAMTPEERRMPTYINAALTEGPIATGWRLTSDPAPPAWRVLTPNYDFWRARRSPVEVRHIEVQIGISGTGLRPKVRTALLQTFRKLDWPAFNQLLESPR